MRRRRYLSLVERPNTERRMSGLPSSPAASSEPSSRVISENSWTPLSPFGAVGSFHSYVSGEPDGGRLRVRYFRREADGALVGTAGFGPGTEGPPGHAHGGSMAALLDEAMGLAAWIRGRAVVAAKIEVEFRRMLPLRGEARFETWVERIDGRKIHVRGRLHDDDGVPYAESRGLFIEIGTDRFKELAASASARREEP